MLVASCSVFLSWLVLSNVGSKSISNASDAYDVNPVQVPLPDPVDEWLNSGGRAILADDRLGMHASELPEIAQEWWSSQVGNDTKLIRLVNTRFGMVFATDSLIFGPCSAVDAAYRNVNVPDHVRTFRCYDPDGRTVDMSQHTSLPYLVGIHYSQVEAMLDDILSVEYQWVANDTVPFGFIIVQEPDVRGTLGTRGFDLHVTVSAGGPVIKPGELPRDLRAWLITLPGLSSILTEGELITVIRTPNGSAYKTDRHLFGPCSAVRFAFGTLEDDHYDTITPNPCSRLRSY